MMLIPALGFFYRCRGGFIGLGPNNTGKSRLFWWAIPITLASLTLLPFGLAWLLAPVCGALAWLSLIFPGSINSRFQNKGWWNYLGMAFAGCWRLMLPLMPVILYYGLMFGYWDLFNLEPIGLLGGLAYGVGWEKLHGKDSGFFFQHSDGRVDRFAQGGSEWAEALFGAFAIGLAYEIAGFMVRAWTFLI